jgi:cytosine/adenosine deaminase-related metal-dependent hydrolase
MIVTICPERKVIQGGYVAVFSTARTLATQLGSGIHIHFEEGSHETKYCIGKCGKVSVDVYEKISFLGPDLVASQCIRPTRQETAPKRGMT